MMIHAAIEVCEPGDVLVVVATSDSTGELGVDVLGLRATLKDLGVEYID